MASAHVIAAGNRTLCGRLLTKHNPFETTWEAFINKYMAHDPSLCERCLKIAVKYNRFTNAQLARVRRDSAPPVDNVPW